MNGPLLVVAFLGLAALSSGCTDEEPPKPAGEPVDLMVDLVIREAWTMDEMARALTRETGVPFVLGHGVDSDRRMRDPYVVLSLQQNLRQHLDELEQWGLWSFTWEDGRYVIREL
ncbi:MAG: hypothetical protein PVG98_06290 [Chromatiales bacterium]|jgi:hypothetical protein